MKKLTMKPKYGKLLNEPIKKIAEQEGWSIWYCYNDKRKNHCRLSYYRNGWPIPKRIKAEILSRTKVLLKGLGIKGQTYWIESLHQGYGYYDKLCINIPSHFQKI